MVLVPLSILLFEQSHIPRFPAYLRSLPTPQMPPLVHPLTRSIREPRQCPITAEDCTMFVGNPATFPGKQFLLEEGGGRDSSYEVTEVKLLKGTTEYLVQFEGCSDCVTVSDQEMMEMLKRSSSVESNPRSKANST